MATVKDRVEDLISDFYSTDIGADIDSAYSAAVASVADSVKPGILLKALDLATNGKTFADAGLVPTVGYKVLEVYRYGSATQDAGNPVKCHPADWAEFLKTSKTDSIYESTEYNPVYSIAAGGRIYVSPRTADASQTNLGLALVFPYPTAIVDADYVADMPNELTQSVVLKTAINLLQSYIGNASQEEEDAEIMQLVQAQTGQYQAEFDREMQRYIEGTGE